MANTELLKTQSGSLVHWTRSQITVGLAPSAASKSVAQERVVLAIQRAAETWNAVRSGQPRLNVAFGPGADVTIIFCQGKWRGDTIDLGKSQFTASLRDGAVTAATVEINECDHTFTAPDEGATGRYDLQAVVTHELGHVLGLGHSDNPAAVMHPNGRGAEVRKPHTDDKTALALIYFGRSPDESTPRRLALGPTDASQTRLAVPPAAGAPATAKPGAEKNTPADQVSVLSLTTVGGRQVMVYTCEPTLLPAIGAAGPHDGKQPRGRRTRKNAR